MFEIDMFKLRNLRSDNNRRQILLQFIVIQKTHVLSDTRHKKMHYVKYNKS